MISSADKTLIRELAKQTAEIASLEVNRERERRIRDMHSLKAVRPPVWVDEIPWHEMDIDGELVLRCESPQARELEQYFRRVLYRWKHIQADMIVEDSYYIEKSYHETGIGIAVKEQTRSSDTQNHIISHHYEDLLDSEEKLDALCLPQITTDREADRQKLETAGEILDGIMPVKLRGHQIYYAPWDVIARYRGIENILVDMIERPELIHRTIRTFTDIYVARYTQMETLRLLDFNVPSLHCTPPYTDECPAADYSGTVRLKDVWFRGMAQLFSSASPAMQNEFDLEYMKPFMERCALSYYGCCEPLDRFIPYLEKIPNMRKIGVTPWANLKSCAEQIGNRYVMARKPNPAAVAGEFNREQVEKEIAETVEAALANGCPYEFVLKDISTVGYKPQNLINWVQTAGLVIDRFYR